MSHLFFRVAAALCFLAVGLGAFGAHGLKATLQAHEMVGVWEKAVLYHFLHAIAILILVHMAPQPRPFVLFLSGILLFSGSLYLMALTNVRWLGAITPLGGLCFSSAGGGWLSHQRLADDGIHHDCSASPESACALPEGKR